MTNALRTDPFDAFGVGRLPGSALAEMVQRLGTGLTDHRGLIELPALAVLFDDLGGLPFFFAEPGASIQSRLSMSMLVRPTIDEVLAATSELVMQDGQYGATTVSIRGTDNRALCVGTARNVRVGRELVAGGDHFDLPDPTPPAAALPPAIDATLAGGEIVAAIADGRLPIGPLATLLGAAVELSTGSSVTMTSRTEAWMGNVMGTMHGGVIATIVAQGISLAAQALTPAGVGYQVLDFSVAFLRSPAVDGRTVSVTTVPVKVGRRLGVFAAELHDGDTLLAHATAEVRFDA